MLLAQGVAFSTVTAGKYKRTLTPTKKLDPADQKKLQEDLEQVLSLFKGFVAKNRPGVDIEKVATGETWFGPDALANGLVDALITVDELLLERVDGGADVLGVTYTEPPKSPLARLMSAGSQQNEADCVSHLLSRGGTAGGSWRAIALTLLARLAGGGADAGAPSVLDGLVDGVTAAESTKTFERQVLAARERNVAHPMLHWRGDDGSGGADEDAADSWFM